MVIGIFNSLAASIPYLKPFLSNPESPASPLLAIISNLCTF